MPKEGVKPDFTALRLRRLVDKVHTAPPAQPMDNWLESRLPKEQDLKEKDGFDPKIIEVSGIHDPRPTRLEIKKTIRIMRAAICQAMVNAGLYRPVDL